MMLWSSNDLQPVYGVLVDVLSGSVGFSLIYSDPHEPQPEILYSHREYIKIVAEPSTDTMVRALRSTLFAAALQFSQDGMAALRKDDKHARVARILLICGAPWARTSTRLIHIEEKEPFSITKEKIGALVQAADERDEEELRRSELLRELNLNLVEHAIVNTAVNGYMVPEPYGMKGRELSLAHISGLMPKALTDAITEIEGKIIPHATRTAHTFALVLFCILRDMHPQVRNALLVDVSGEATELSIMQDEVLLETVVFPHGGHTVARDIAKELKTLPEEAMAHMNEQSAASPQNVGQAVLAAGERYTAAFSEALALLSERYIIPKHIYVITPRKTEKFFTDVLSKVTEGHRGQHGSFMLLNEELFKGSKLSAEERDAFVNIEARFFHKLHGCGDIT